MLCEQYQMKIMILRLGLVSISATFVYIKSMTLHNTQPEQVHFKDKTFVTSSTAT